jgi:hypothetical protein
MATEAPSIITPSKTAAAPMFQGFLDQGGEDGGDWLDHGEYASEFEPALGIFLNGHIDIEWDPTMPLEKARQQSQVGYRAFKVGKHWEVGLNWKRTWEKKLPPHHMGVAYKDKVVGFLSPLMHARTCWKCGSYGWYEVPFDERLRDPSLPDRIPFCAPNVACPGRGLIVDGKPVDWKACGCLDWWGHVCEAAVTRYEFQIACAEVLAHMEGDDDQLFENLSTGYDSEGNSFTIQ